MIGLLSLVLLIILVLLLLNYLFTNKTKGLFKDLLIINSIIKIRWLLAKKIYL